MSQNTPVTTSVAQEEAWREIELVVQQITRLSRSDASTEQFFAELLERSVRTLAAAGGAVWLLRPEGYSLEYQINLAATGLVSAPQADELPDREERQLAHQRLLQHVAKQGRRRAISPLAGGRPEASREERSSAGVDSEETTPPNPTDYLLLVCPVTVDASVAGLVEVFQHEDVSPSAVQGYLRFLGALCELAADFLRNQQLREYKERSQLWTAFERFTESVHFGLDRKRIATAIANDGRQLIGCDRLSVALRHGAKYQLIAVSGLESIDRRSVVVRHAQELIRRVAQTNEPFWYVDTEETGAPSGATLPPQIARPLGELLDESPARVLAVLPLLAPEHPVETTSTFGASPSKRQERARPIGALLVERFEAAPHSGQLRHRADVVARQSSAALANALQYSDLPLLSVLKLFGRLGWHLKWRQLPRTVLVLGTLIAAVAALIVVPGDFTIEGRGELQPAVRRGVFASADGIISLLSDQLLNRDTPTVSKGDTLIELTSSSLDFERTRVAGELRTAERSLETTRIERNTVDGNDPNWRSRLEQLAAQEIEYETLIDSLKAQLAILERQSAELKLQSQIDGQILTWDAVQLLQNRPVRRGERLLEVADVDGEWVLEIRVPDQNIGYVHAAQRELKPDLSVTFVLATNPEREWRGTVRDIARTTSSHPEDGPTVLVTVAIDRSEIPLDELRPGATVIPRIHCGRRPIGFVWFHELYHVLQTKVFF
ncbi:HlyD family efflux transporter periplasmic adaptor subunit [bacterium]|nr:HlyD family efflux transporter periplasmic adaptor subunit [bacterium]